MVNISNFGSGGPGPCPSLAVAFFPETISFAPLFLSSPRCINLRVVEYVIIIKS